MAFLVGINNYPEDGALRGCVNDVQLIQNLLVHRFGFQAQDIVTLLDEKATRQGILTTFEEHLIKQAKPDDVVVFHYSGHGSRVFDPYPIDAQPGKPKIGLNGTFVPIDGGFPNVESGGTVQDIMGHTLFLLMSACRSENFTAVLDSCFSGAATRKFKVRAREGGSKVQIASLEKEYQQKWLSRLNLSPQEFIKRYQKGVAKGVVLAATNPDQTAADARFNGFHAGAFTYNLTQHLWQTNDTPKSTISQIVKKLSQEQYEQIPILDAKAGSGNEKKPLFFTKPVNTTADAVITEVKGKQAKLWLGGVDIGSIDKGSEFRTVSANKQSKGSATKVKLISRDGLVGVAIVEGNLKPGTLLQVIS